MFKEDYEKVKEFCRENKINLARFEREIYCKLEKQYDLEDIEKYCQDECNFSEDEFEIVKKFDMGDYECIRERYRDNYDCNYGVWDNLYHTVMEYIREAI